MAESNNNNAVVDRDSILNAPKFYKQPQTKNFDLQIESSDASVKVIESRISSSTKISSSSSTSIKQSTSFKSSSIESTETLEIQVKEGSRAESAGIKCGDSIIRINNIATEGMSLTEAQRALEYAADDLRLTLSRYRRHFS